MNSSTPTRYFALIPAAGVGARMLADCPKQYLHINGKSILQHSVHAFLKNSQINHVFVVASEGDSYVGRELQADPRLTVLFCGGTTRTESVMNGLREMNPLLNQLDWVLVHDAARPGLNQTLIHRLIDSVGQDEAGGLLALPVVDTVKLMLTDSTKKKLTTISRTDLWLAQTPQMFRYRQLMDALTSAKTSQTEITDEASAIEAAGLVPKLVEGHWCNAKITRPDDLALVELYLTHFLVD